MILDWKSRETSCGFSFSDKSSAQDDNSRYSFSMRRMFALAIGISLAIHALVIAILWIRTPSVPKPQEEPTVVDLVFDETPASQSPRHVTSNKTFPTNHDTRIAKPSDSAPVDKSLLAFQPTFRQSLIDRIETVNSEDAVVVAEKPRPPMGSDPMLAVETMSPRDSTGWSSGVQYMNAMDYVFTINSLGYFTALHNRINSQLIYPEDFARQRITGKVRIEAELGKDGKLIRFLSSTTDDRLLQTYCFAFLVQVLQHPLPQRLWLEYEKAVVSFDFDFRTRVDGMVPTEFAMGVEKSHLMFGREAAIDPWLNEKIHEVLTHYVPPIIPLPGGFYVDYVLALQYVKNLIEGAPTEREQRQARIDNLHERLRTLLHRAVTEPTPSPTAEPES